MAVDIRVKRSSSAGTAPSSLEDGELAINVADTPPKAYVGDGTSVLTLGPVIVTGTTPSAPTAGTIWVNDTTRVVQVYASSSWNSISGVDDFSAAEDYVSGQLVIYQDGLWQANTSITASAWDVSEWDPISTKLNNYAGTTAPATTDDTSAGYAPGSLWVDTTNDLAYICLDATASSAVWTEITATGLASNVEWTYREKVTADNTSPNLDLTDFQNTWGSGLDHRFVGREIIPATNNASFTLLYSDDTGGSPTYEGAGGYSYEVWGRRYADTDTTAIQSTRAASAASIPLTVYGIAKTGTSFRDGFWFDITVHDVDGSNFSLVTGDVWGTEANNSTPLHWHVNAFFREAVQTVEAIRVAASSGNIESGTIEHYTRPVR